MIKELGANTIRLAHYQHSQDFYDACDEFGFAVWAEIPFISVMTKTNAAHENCKNQLKELIIQNYNHPSIMFWGISNEILIGGISQELIENHKELNNLAKELDPTRLTAIAHVSMTPTEGPIHYITDTESYNNYYGWYGGKLEDNGPWLDEFHKKHPTICLGLSEYGCEGILTYQNDSPKIKDYSETYQALYHEHMAKVLDERPWIWSSHVWNMFDFGCAARNEGGVSGRNNKGLVTIDRKTKKDSYYIYKAYWNPEPMVHIAGKRYAQRSGETTEIRIYTNQDKVSLYLNGSFVEEKSAIDKVAIFTIALANGMNTLLAVAGGVKDSASLENVDKEPDIYVMPPEPGTNNEEGAANWFSLMGDLDLPTVMEFPEGMYSIKDTFETIYENEEAFAIIYKPYKMIINVELGPELPQWSMMKSMTPEKLFPVINMPEGTLERVNAQLIKIKK